MQPSREIILKKIQKATAQPVPLPFPDREKDLEIFKNSGQEKEIEFAENFVALQGRFSFCADESELHSQLETLIAARSWQKIFCSEPSIQELLGATLPEEIRVEALLSCEAAITSCEALVARTGTIVTSSAQQNGRTSGVYAPVHICIAFTDQLYYDVGDVLAFLQKKYKDQLPSSISFSSGPSRTADIEKTLVTGVHGPKEVFCFLVQK